MSHYDMTSQGTTNLNMTTNSEMLNLKGESKKRKKSKNKNKNNNDDVDEVAVGVSQNDFTSEMGNTTSMMLDGKPSKGKKTKDGKKKKRKDKNKGKDDNIDEVSMGRQGAGDDEFMVVDHDKQKDATPGKEVQLGVSSDKDKGKKTKGSTDEPSGSSSSDKKKVKKDKKKKSNKDDGSAQGQDELL